MGGPDSQTSQRLFDLLGDGDWHDLLAVIAEASKTVPPGRAVRHHHSSGSLDTHPLDHRVERGQRGVAVNRVTQWRGRGFLEFDPPLETGRKVDWHQPRRVRATPKLLAHIARQQR
jgi:hypothetical protein